MELQCCAPMLIGKWDRICKIQFVSQTIGSSTHSMDEIFTVSSLYNVMVKFWVGINVRVSSHCKALCTS